MKDAMGNDLKVGDLVMLQLDRPVIFGRVVDCQEGGLVTGMRKGGTEVRPARLVIASNHTVEIDPRQLVGSVVALRDPAVIVEAENLPASEIPLTN